MKWIVEEVTQGYWDKDGCIPGIENGTWVSTGPARYEVWRESRGKCKHMGTFPSRRAATQFVKDRKRG